MHSWHDNPQFLYRYRPLTADMKNPARDVLQDELTLIEKGFIWLSKQRDLNDPFDCLPVCSPAQKHRLDQLLDKFFVGSLSSTPPDREESSPMWSYYADNHRGICIEFPFNKEKASTTIPIEKVRYSKSRFDLRGLDPNKMRITSPVRLGVVVPEAEINDPANNIDILELTRKSEAWKHEHEWRYIWSQNYARPLQSLEFDRAQHGQKAEHKVLISKPTKVILGAQMDSRTKIHLTKALSKIGIRTVEAVRSETDYTLNLIG